MRRRRWPPLAAACLIALVVLLAAVHGGGASASMPADRRSGASIRSRARVAAFDTTIARCKKQGKSAGPACARLPGGGGDDDDKRVVPTGSNPLHNR
ncbi:unnamed protein product [Miscanthus lutarioriparius]|uniref:Uncharacterized protein n=1 Tax=Miscanthus lutarioriparius TaxID=422564 RepID=A0A811Q8P3_9POAL|nr:unnamed protein product [Miscanthus lutarioriparius]